jgi:hypothetical protein
MPAVEFFVHKSNSSSPDEYLNALACARDSVESVLDDGGLHIELRDNSIVINAQEDGRSHRLEKHQLKSRIKGCFCDRTGVLYPEFSKISYE